MKKISKMILILLTLTINTYALEQPRQYDFRPNNTCPLETEVTFIVNSVYTDIEKMEILYF